jgi:hypothetical protein
VIEPELLANVLGAGGVASAIVWGLLRDRRAILIGQGAQAICFGAHFAVIGAYTGAAMCALSLVQLGAAASARSRAAALAFWGTAPAIVLLAGWSWHGAASAAAVLGLALATIGRWQRDPLALRWYFIFSTLGWASHNLLVASPFGLATDVMALSTNGWRIWRGRTDRRKEHHHAQMAEKSRRAPGVPDGCDDGAPARRSGSRRASRPGFRGRNAALPVVRSIGPVPAMAR